MIATDYGCTDIVQYLVEKGGNINVPNKVIVLQLILIVANL